MITWNHFIYFSIGALIFWILAAWISYKKEKLLLPTLFTLLGIIIFGTYIVSLWVSLERPPLRTMGETRLWYSFFLPIVGLITYLRWKYKWILSFSTLLALVFIVVNIAKPEIHNKTLMPALQSPWFAPHVIIYMFSYALLGAGAVVSVYFLFLQKKKTFKPSKLLLIDNFIYVGTAFLTIGMLFGALWAKEAWGHYWSWDPKETWAAATWIAYLIYIHYRNHKPKIYKIPLWIVIFSFVLLQICWWGINYLPSAQGSSIHTYTMD